MNVREAQKKIVIDKLRNIADAIEQDKTGIVSFEVRQTIEPDELPAVYAEIIFTDPEFLKQIEKDR